MFTASSAIQKHKRYTTGYSGFTLVELLVSIVIIGLLSAIALPSYLSQAAKTRASEAKSMLGVINRSQQTYYLEKQTFASSLTFLDAKISGKFYSYSVGGSVSSSNVGTIAQNIESNMKVSSALVTQSSGTFVQIICESQDTQPINTSATLPISNTQCSSGYSIVN